MAPRQCVTDYKFSQFKNYKVFTTRQWCENNDRITTVIREINGKWQFLTEEIDLDDVRAIPLVELVDNDPTLNKLHKLKRGQRAIRKSLTEEWEIVDEPRKPYFPLLTEKLSKGSSNFHGRLHIAFALILLMIFFPKPFSYYIINPLYCHFQPTHWDNTLSIFMGLACFINGYYVVLQKKLILEGYKNLLFILVSTIILYIQGFFTEVLWYNLWYAW